MTASPEPEPGEAEIQKAAYFIWLASGCQPGHDLENWLAAKEYLKHHHGRSGGRGPLVGTRPGTTLPPHHLTSR